ncbi:MAG: hypothetical protein IPP22_15500 [Nitrosomonas sp.]|nr:hypothetical protein [Nitrosomonas sp.]
MFLVERETIYKRIGKITDEVVLGVTSRTSEQASPERILKVNRGHWTIENRCHYVIDWNFDEDRSRIRTGHGPRISLACAVSHAASLSTSPRTNPASSRKCSS